MSGTKTVISLCLILIAVFTAFYPSLNNGFTNWDDGDYVTENKLIRNPSLKTLAGFFTSTYFANYHPLTMLSYTAEYSIFGLNPRAYHATNLALHLLNSLLVFWLIFLLTKSNFTAFAVAMLFGVHPMHVESVAWVSERKDVLYSSFFLGSLVSYLYYRRDGRTGYYHLAILAFILSLLSKPMAVTLPFVLLLLDYFSDIRITPGTLKKKIPFFVLAVCFGAFTLAVQQEVVRKDSSFTFLNSLLAGSYGSLFYIAKTILPVKLSCFYPYPEKLGLVFQAAPAAALALAALAVFSARYTRVLLFGLLFYLVTLLPVMQFIPIGKAITADRYHYIPSIGLLFLAGKLAFLAYGKKAAGVKFLAVLALTGLVSFSVFLTFKRNLVWKDSFTLWNDVLKNYPGNSTAYNNRGTAYLALKEYDKAAADFQEAKRSEPGLSDAYFNLGSAYSAMGETEKTLAEFKAGLALRPEAKAYCRLGNIYKQKKEYAEALRNYEKALELDPRHSETYDSRGTLRSETGDLNSALSDFNKAIEMDPFSASAYTNRGLIFANTGDPDRALADYEKAVKIAPLFAAAYSNRGLIFAGRGEFDRALSDYGRAIEIDPLLIAAYNNRGLLYADKAAFDKALPDYNAAIRINPEYGDAYNNRAIVYYSVKEYKKAAEDLRQALKLGVKVNPGFISAMRQYLKK